MARTTFSIGEIQLEGLDRVNEMAIGPIIHKHLSQLSGSKRLTHRGMLDLGNLSLEVDPDAGAEEIGMAIAQAIYSQVQG